MRRLTPRTRASVPKSCSPACIASTNARSSGVSTSSEPSRTSTTTRPARHEQLHDLAHRSSVSSGREANGTRARWRSISSVTARQWRGHSSAPTPANVSNAPTIPSKRCARESITLARSGAATSPGADADRQPRPCARATPRRPRPRRPGTSRPCAPGPSVSFGRTFCSARRCWCHGVKSLGGVRPARRLPRRGRRTSCGAGDRSALPPRGCASGRSRLWRSRQCPAETSARSRIRAARGRRRRCSVARRSVTQLGLRLVEPLADQLGDRLAHAEFVVMNSSGSRSVRSIARRRTRRLRVILRALSDRSQVVVPASCRPAQALQRSTTSSRR